MKLTIIPADSCVYKNNISYSGLVLAGIPQNIHALQWNNTKGWIEFVEDENFNKTPNEIIEELPEWALSAVSMWEIAKTTEEEYIKQIQSKEVKNNYEQYFQWLNEVNTPIKEDTPLQPVLDPLDPSGDHI